MRKARESLESGQRTSVLKSYCAQLYKWESVLELDWPRGSDDVFDRELKERRINHHCPKHTSHLVAEPLRPTDTFSMEFFLGTASLCKVWLCWPQPLELDHRERVIALDFSLK